MVYNKFRTLRNCVKVARMTLTHFVWVRILVPQPKTGKIRKNLAGFSEVISNSEEGRSTVQTRYSGFDIDKESFNFINKYRKEGQKLNCI